MRQRAEEEGVEPSAGGVRAGRFARRLRAAALPRLGAGRSLPYKRTYELEEAR